MSFFRYQPHGHRLCSVVVGLFLLCVDAARRGCKRLRDKAKTWLNTRAAERMTSDRLAQTQGPVNDWV